MALELHVAGPGIDFTRRLHSGDAAVVLGRDTDCTICLPDPERNVSRRHLSVWNQDDELHFQVLSVVNGVDLPAGLVPPGGRGVLGIGQSLVVSAYRLHVSLVSPADDTTDPWAALEQVAGSTGTMPRASAHFGNMTDSPDTVPAMSDEDDPFGDWGFGSTFGPGAPGGMLQADALAAAKDLQPFFHGLGLDASKVPTLSQGELEAIGRLTRVAVLGVIQAMQAARAAKQELRTDDRTMLGARESNPLHLDGPPEAKLHYLFGGRAAAGGFISPDRALAELVSDLLAHQQSVGPATREALEGVLDEFDPETLKARLLGTGARLFESARAWEAFVRDYADQGADRTHWVQRLLDKHFVDAYLREFVRVKRDTSSRRK